MLRSSVLLFVLIALLPLSLFGQTKKGSESNTSTSVESSDYKLNIRYATNIFHKYTLTEESDVVRRFSDSSEVKFTRKVKYYMSLVQNSLAENGFTSIKVMIDSMEYEFVEAGGKVYKFDSQDDDSDAPFNHIDFLCYSMALGREYYLTYSPYNEVAKVDGELLVESRRLVNDADDGMKDQRLKYLWNRGLGDKFLTFLGDIQKNLIPVERVKMDSTWTRPFEVYVDGVRYQDTAKATLKHFSSREFIVEAVLDSLVGADELFNTTGIDELIAINSSKGKGTVKLKVSPRGQINDAEIKLQTEFKAAIRKEVFTQTSNTVYKWNLVRMYK